MNKNPIVFAMANPDPEILPEEARPFASVVATGRSDYPNQINNVQPGASGLPVPGYQAKIVDDDGNEVATGETGSLMITGDSLLKHYWRNPDKTNESLRNGWMYTGDTYYKDEKGFYFCCGRSDDMLKVGGNLKLSAAKATIECVSNRMVFFPSYLEHMVKPNDQAMTISGNIEIVE